LRVEAGQQLVVRGDRDLLFEAVANLVDNAIKFTPEGGKVDIELTRGDGETIVRVTDTGCGIGEQRARGRAAAFLPLRQDPKYPGRRPWS
jgi:signal transduction histidine kinase